jgi:hypothetical protein
MPALHLELWSRPCRRLIRVFRGRAVFLLDTARCPTRLSPDMAIESPRRRKPVSAIRWWVIHAPLRRRESGPHGCQAPAVRWKSRSRHLRTRSPACAEFSQPGGEDGISPDASGCGSNPTAAHSRRKQLASICARIRPYRSPLFDRSGRQLVLVLLEPPTPRLEPAARGGKSTTGPPERSKTQQLLGTNPALRSVIVVICLLSASTNAARDSHRLAHHKISRGVRGRAEMRRHYD